MSLNTAAHQGLENDNNSTMNYESMRAAALLNSTRAAWGYLKSTAKTNPFIQLCMYSAAPTTFFATLQALLDWFQVSQIHL